MRTLALLITMFVATAAHGQQLCDLAPEWRQSNWPSRNGYSCGHASTVGGLRWLEAFETADEWRRTHGGGLNIRDHLQMLRENGISYVATTDGDERVLEYGIESRRGAIIYWGPNGGHVTFLVGRENGKAVILDNNHTKTFTRIAYDEWTPSWHRQGGEAIVILGYQVPPPVPE